MPGIVTVECVYHWQYWLFQKYLYNGITNIQNLERWTVFTLLSVNVFITLTTQ
jgi:hypothetical protein